MKNERGFTLIELLAVITIMGILLMVAIPTISRTIENSRKDTFIDMVKNYSSAARTMWTGDNLMCDGVVSSAVPLGVYYIEINTMSDSVPVLLEQGGKSPWGNRDVLGVIAVGVRDRNNSRHVSFYPAITDGVHGVNIKSDGSTVVSSLKADNTKTRNQLKEETLSRCKVDLINAMSRIQNGYDPTEEERRILIEEKETYNHLGGNSYVDDMFDRLKKEGKLWKS